MLNENIKSIRKSKGLSQEELAVKLNVVRQTISKWEQGLSVPDSDMLISISEVLETPVSTLLGETISESKADDLRAISEKLEVINLQVAQRKQGRQKAIHWFFIFLCVIIVIAFAVLILLNTHSYISPFQPHSILKAILPPCSHQLHCNIGFLSQIPHSLYQSISTLTRYLFIHYSKILS